MSTTPAFDVVVCIWDRSSATSISHMNRNSIFRPRAFSLPPSENSAEGRRPLHLFVSEKQTLRMRHPAAELLDSQVQ